MQEECLLYCFDMENQSGQVKFEDIEKQEKQKQEKQQKEENFQQKQEEIKQEIQQTSQETNKLDIFFENIIKICDQMMCTISQERRIKPDIKDDCEYILGCLVDNAKKQDINNISALVVSGEYLFKNIKRTIKSMQML